MSSDFQLGSWEVRPSQNAISRNGKTVHLEPKMVEVLVCLAEHRGETVSKDELLRQVWGDTFVTDDVLIRCISELRRALGDDAKEPRVIQTIPKRGYRLLLTVGKTAEHLAAATRRTWNTRRIAIAAGVAALVILIAFATRGAFSVRPHLSESDVILLANFVNKTGDPIFDNSLDRALEVKLTESPFLSLFPEAEVRRTLTTMRRDPNERVTRELGVEICNRQGLKAVVVPEIDGVGNKYVITLVAIDAKTQKSLARKQEEVEGKDKVIAALGKVATGMRKELGESLGSLEKYDAPLDLATTSSLEALQAYRAGLIQFRSGKTRESIPFFERAVEVDPRFCSAYAMLGHSHFSIGNGQAARKYFAKAFELRDERLTQEENFQVTAFYHSYITGNLEKQIAILLLYEQAYPRSVVAANRLGIAYAMLGKKEEALQKFNWAIEHSTVPSAQYYSNASQALLVMDRFDEAKKLIDQWWQRGSLSPFQREMRYRIAYFENDTVTMERLAREMPEDDVRWFELRLQLAFLRGEIGRVRSMSQAMVDRDRHAKQMEDVADDLALHAQLESFLGDRELARSLCRKAKEIGRHNPIQLWRCGEAFGYSGDMTQAENFATKLDQMAPEDTLQQKVYLPLIRSVVERERGNFVQAADLLTSAVQYGETLDVNYQQAQAFLAVREHAKAAAEFKNILTHRGSGWWHVYAPLAKLGLARAYAGQGASEMSRKAYEDFFTTWKDADPNIPILIEAKAEYQALTFNGIDRSKPTPDTRKNPLKGWAKRKTSVMPLGLRLSNSSRGRIRLTNSH